MAVINWIIDRYLTWRTGCNKEERAWRQWCDQNIVARATTIENMFMNFQYIIPVSTSIFDANEPFGWCPCEDFKQYLYPNRELGDNAVYYFARGYRDPWDGQFHFNELRCDPDQVFVATNNLSDAITITLRWA